MANSAGRSNTALFLSPHLDDVAFSCGGTFAMLAAAGWRCVLATLFTRSVPHPRGFALECQTSKGLPADVDYMRQRRIEDAVAAVHLGASDVHWGPLPEAPHRGYDSAAALFEPLRVDDPLATDGDSNALDSAITALCRGHQPGIVFAPQSSGRHVDHVLTSRVVLRADVAAVAWYADTPYVLRENPIPPPPEIASRLGSLQKRRVDLEAAAQSAKLDACAAYASQLGFQFGSESAMRQRLIQVTAEPFCVTAAADEILAALGRTD